MPTLLNRVKVNIPTTGTGDTLTIGSAVENYQTFTDAGLTGDATCSYVIEEGANWELGVGLFDFSAGTFVRSAPSESTNNNAQIELFGSAVLYVTALAGDIVQPGDNISTLTNDAGYTTNVGDITAVTAGTGMDGGGTSGDVTVSLSAATQASLALADSAAQAVDVETATIVRIDGTTITSPYTLVAGDRGQVVTTNSTGAVVVQIPQNLFAVGSAITVIRENTGSATITALTGVTVNGGTSVTISDQYQGVALLQVASNVWIASGALG